MLRKRKEKKRVSAPLGTQRGFHESHEKSVEDAQGDVIWRRKTTLDGCSTRHDSPNPGNPGNPGTSGSRLSRNDQEDRGARHRERPQTALRRWETSHDFLAIYSVRFATTIYCSTAV